MIRIPLAALEVGFIKIPITATKSTNKQKSSDLLFMRLNQGVDR